MKYEPVDAIRRLNDKEDYIINNVYIFNNYFNY
jgi:hypothetical protein